MKSDIHDPSELASMPAAPRWRRPSPRVRRLLGVTAALLFVYTIVGFFVLPPIVRSQLQQRLSSALGRRVAVERVQLNPFTFSATVERFAVYEPDGTTPFLGWRRLYVNVGVIASLGGTVVFDEIALDGFDSKVVRLADGSFNFSDLLQRFSAETPRAEPGKEPAPMPAIRIRKLDVAHAQVEVADRSRRQPFVTVVGPVTFALSDFRTVTSREAPYQFEALTESGEKLAWSGTVQVNPLRSVGDFDVQRIALPKYAPYYADRIRADITGGTVSIRGHYECSLAEPNVMTLSRGAVEVRGLKIVERESRELMLELPALDITGLEADALALRASARAVVLSRGMVRLRRDADGALNVLTALTPAADQKETPSAGASTRPDVRLGELAIHEFTVDITDNAAARPATLGLSRVECVLQNVTLAKGAAMPIQLAFDWAPKGTVRVGGTVSADPVQAKLKADVTDFDLLPLSPYVEQFVNAHVTTGAVSTSVEVAAEFTPDRRLDLLLSGDLAVDHFGVVDAAQNQELAGFSALRLSAIRARTQPDLGLAIDKIEMQGPMARVAVGADGKLNVASLSRATANVGPAAGSKSDAATPTATPPKLDVREISITGGDFQFADGSLSPNVKVAVTQFGGTIAGLSSEHPGQGSVDLKATVDGIGPVAITGKLDPLGAKPFVDLKITARNVDLVPLSPYTGKFAGYELSRGKLAADVKIVVEGNKIDAGNVVTLQQFTLGAPVESPDATKLPVRLAVALLKDVDGNIVIDLPVEGSTDDPNFRVGRVVLRVITNLLTKAAVSPFTLLGAAFGGGGDELAFQEFAPGSSALLPSEEGKLQTLVRALNNRPGLSLGIEGSYDPAADAYALKRLRLDDRIRRAIWEAKRQTNPNIAPPDQLVVTADEIAAMTKTLFDEQFPPGTKFGTPLPAAPAIMPPPAPPPGGWFKRFVRVVTFAAQREKRATERENQRVAVEHEKAVAAAVTAGLPVEEMTGRLAEAVSIEENDLRALALSRAQRVREYFVANGKISADRLFLAQPPTVDATHPAKGLRVLLQLQ